MCNLKRVFLPLQRNTSPEYVLCMVESMILLMASHAISAAKRLGTMRLGVRICEMISLVRSSLSQCLLNRYGEGR
ncbi:hypothetical protein HAX54_034810 [Datura stramonium]|uniref:Uncharacterized protein n=1 Tax=Datura stramonium TaxID=4076 RepID=A0ABS8VI37_DATST|nr:hypothetical protein [Datura stramonium]